MVQWNKGDTMTIGFSEFMQSFENGFFDFLFNFISFLGEEYIFYTSTWISILDI